jgi:hypothetical protein
MLDRLIFKFGDKEVELTRHEAWQLHVELSMLFGAPDRVAPPWPLVPFPHVQWEAGADTTAGRPT